MYKWRFRCMDNSGKCQGFIVYAKNKPDAIRKGLNRAKRFAMGDILPNWRCNLLI